MTATAASVIWLTHGRSSLALHLVREGWGRPLLILPGLGEDAPAEVPEHLSRWAGPVYALEVTGHGRSSRTAGGGYTAEILMADADAALTHLGSATIFGRGLGAYLALLVGGARPHDVHGVIVADGPGLVGGGIRPASTSLAAPLPDTPGGPDPYVLLEMSRDVRPPDYVVEFARLLTQASSLDEPVTVTTVVRPEWLIAVLDTPGVVEGTLEDALRRYGEPKRS